MMCCMAQSIFFDFSLGPSFSDTVVSDFNRRYRGGFAFHVLASERHVDSQCDVGDTVTKPV